MGSGLMIRFTGLLYRHIEATVQPEIDFVVQNIMEPKFYIISRIVSKMTKI
jgi:hypothetical protein